MKRQGEGKEDVGVRGQGHGAALCGGGVGTEEGQTQFICPRPKVPSWPLSLGTSRDSKWPTSGSHSSQSPEHAPGPYTWASSRRGKNYPQ